ncbi:MAG: methyltransferase, partial [Actinomycetota bacterium]|nr:methyltransferase [Actinomycetota bacterium]
MISPDPGSFRDPASRVVHDGDRILRVLDDRGLAAWQSVKNKPFFNKAVAEGRIIATDRSDVSISGAAGVLEHPRLPIITYPYEWTFSMLKDAALLQLDLLAEALSDGITIKDATPFNIQFVSGRPVFIDIGSFEPYRDGEPWIGYRQFTRQFLFPLMLKVWSGIPHQTWLRGDIEGPTAQQTRQLLPSGKRKKPSVLLHVSLQAKMEERMSGEAVRTDLKSAGFSSDLILANVSKLRKLVGSLTWDPEVEGWSDYDSCTHVGRDRDSKSGFLSKALDRTHPEVVADLGANDAHFSLIAAEAGAHAVAIDGDEPVLDHVYRNHDGSDLTLVVSDLTNPTPAQGWAGVERPALFDRVKPDLIIAYGVIHHLIYTASVPPGTVMSWLRSFECPVVVEFVAPEDEMVAKLTANKLDQELHQDRTEAEFRTLLADL